MKFLNNPYEKLFNSDFLMMREIKRLKQIIASNQKLLKQYNLEKQKIIHDNKTITIKDFAYLNQKYENPKILRGEINIYEDRIAYLKDKLFKLKQNKIKDV